MPTAEKSKVIEQAKDWYAKSTGVFFTDFRGLKVKEMQALRKDLRSKGGEIHVLKNTLFRIAAGEDAAKLPTDLHNGTTAVAFVFENESAVAKALLDYAKSSKKLVVKGGFFSGKSLDAKGVTALSELPPRDILIAQLIGVIAAPLSNLVGVVEALYADPIRVIGAVADKVAESNPIPVPAKAVEAPAPVAEAPAEEAAPAEAPAAEEASAPEVAAEETPAESTDSPTPAAEEAAEAPVTENE